MVAQQGTGKKRWYALYTKSRAEKKVAKELQLRGIEAYLPLEKRLKQWSDRKKWVEEPLIRSYIFVHTNLKGLHNAVYTPGVVKIVTFEGKPAPIPDKQIQAIKNVLSSKEIYEVTSDNFELGEMVEVKQGRLKGLQGEMVRHLNKYKVLIRIEVIQQNLMVNINPSYLKKMEEKV
ncbi:MAG: UpxY family transcription antiterminator [Bacteroidales bacterium]